MNTLIEIALTAALLKACHCPTVELLRLLGGVTRVDGSTLTWKQSTQTKKHQNFAQLIPDLLVNTQRASENIHTHSLLQHPHSDLETQTVSL